MSEGTNDRGESDETISEKGQDGQKAGRKEGREERVGVLKETGDRRGVMGDGRGQQG